MTASDDRLLFACGRVSLGFTSQWAMFASPFHRRSFDPSCVRAPVLSDITPSLSTSAPSDTLSVSRSSFLSHTNAERSLRVSPWLDFSFCVITRLLFCVLLQPAAAGFLHVSSSPSWCHRLFFCEPAKLNTLFLWTRLDRDQLPSPSPGPISFWWRLQQERCYLAKMKHENTKRQKIWPLTFISTR